MMSSNPFRNTALCVWYFRVPKLFVICSIGTLIISEFRPLQLKCCGVSGDVNSTDSWAIYKTKSEWYRTRESGKNTNKNISGVRIWFQPIKGLFSSLKLMMLNMKYNTGMVYWRKKYNIKSSLRPKQLEWHFSLALCCFMHGNIN